MAGGRYSEGEIAQAIQNNVEQTINSKSRSVVTGVLLGTEGARTAGPTNLAATGFPNLGLGDASGKVVRLMNPVAAQRFAELERDVHAAGGSIPITSMYRSFQHQLNLWNEKKRDPKRHPYPVANPYSGSPHMGGYAFDTNVDQWGIPREKALALAKKNGFEWGGHWTGSSYDPVHFQVSLRSLGYKSIQDAIQATGKPGGLVAPSAPVSPSTEKKTKQVQKAQSGGGRAMGVGIIIPSGPELLDAARNVAADIADAEANAVTKYSNQFDAELKGWKKQIDGSSNPVVQFIRDSPLGKASEWVGDRVSGAGNTAANKWGDVVHAGAAALRVRPAPKAPAQTAQPPATPPTATQGQPVSVSIMYPSNNPAGNQQRVVGGGQWSGPPITNPLDQVAGLHPLDIAKSFPSGTVLADMIAPSEGQWVVVGFRPSQQTDPQARDGTAKAAGSNLPDAAKAAVYSLPGGVGLATIISYAASLFGKK